MTQKVATQGSSPLPSGVIRDANFLTVFWRPEVHGEGVGMFGFSEPSLLGVPMATLLVPFLVAPFPCLCVPRISFTSIRSYWVRVPP